MSESSLNSYVKVIKILKSEFLAPKFMPYTFAITGVNHVYLIRAAYFPYKAL